jgi:uncharacterized protein (DUF1330 family)
MNKAYMITLIYEIKDYDKFKEYLRLSSPIWDSYRPRLVFSTSKLFNYTQNDFIIQTVDKYTPDIINVWEFEDKKTLFDCYYNEDYQKLNEYRNSFTNTKINFIFDNSFNLIQYT